MKAEVRGVRNAGYLEKELFSIVFKGKIWKKSQKGVYLRCKKSQKGV